MLRIICSILVGSLILGCSPPNVEISAYWYNNVQNFSEQVRRLEESVKKTPIRYSECYVATNRAIDGYNSVVLSALADNVITNEEYYRIDDAYDFVQKTFTDDQLLQKKNEILDAAKKVKE